MKSKFFSWSLSLTALFSLASHGQEVTLKVHEIFNTQSVPHALVLQPWCDRIASESNNRMKCQVFPAMQLGGTPAQLIDQVQDGVVDIIFTMVGYTAGRFPVMEVFELPFMTSSAEAGSAAAWEFHKQHAQKEFSGIKPLMLSVHEPGYIHTRNKQIRTLADFKGLKIRAPSRMTNKLLASLGATPVAMPLPAVAEATNKGVIDGFLLPWDVMPSLRLEEIVTYHTETSLKKPALYTAMNVIAMNPASYAKLPTDLKAIIDKNSGEGFSRASGRTWDEIMASTRKPAVDRGNTFYTVPDAELETWVKASSSLYQEWVTGMSNAGLPGQEMLEQARNLIVKHQRAVRR